MEYDDNNIGRVIAISRADGLFFISRRSHLAVRLPLKAVLPFRETLSKAPPSIPTWLHEVLVEIGEKVMSGEAWTNVFVFRGPTEYAFEKVAWEITERCNFRCIHCYLDEKLLQGLQLDSRLRVLDKLEKTGCLWLQITGGEALADPLFEQTYRAAWKRGFLLSIITNGKLIRRWLELFRSLPPYRITVSLYGATGASYEAMTGVESAFMDVLSGLDAAKEAGVAIRVSIIVTKVNAHEVSDMEHMIRARGIDYHTFWQLSPTLKGNSFPLDYEADIKRVPVFFHGNKGCSGGKTTLHVYASGRASPCRLLPHISIDLLSEEFSNLTRLELHPGTRPTRPECAECPSIEYCTTCAPVLALHKNARKMSRRICRW